MASHFCAEQLSLGFSLYGSRSLRFVRMESLACTGPKPQTLRVLLGASSVAPSSVPLRASEAKRRTQEVVQQAVVMADGARNGEQNSHAVVVQEA